MQIQDLPYKDPGVPDARSGPRFLWWLGRNQLGGQFKALAWGLLHFTSVAGLPFCVGSAIQAVVDRSGSRLALAGVLLMLCGFTIALGDTFLHRSAVTNWITAAARVQQLLARKTAQLGSALTRRVAAGEIVAVSTGDVERIGWFVEAVSRFTAAALTVVLICVGLVVYQPALGIIVAVGVPVLALSVLPLLPRATRRADFQREKAGRATELASDTVAGLRVLRGIGGEELFLDRYRRASQEVRHAAVRSARMWALISGVQVLLPGLLIIAVVWHGVGLAREGRITIGELVTVYSAVMLLAYPLRHFEEIAMAYSFSRPSAKRAAGVLSLERATDTEGSREAAVPTGDLYDPATGLLAPAGCLTAVVCGDPDAAGRLAERLGGHATEEGTSVLLDGVPLDELPLDSARTAVLVQDKDPVLLSGTLRELLDVPASGEVTTEEALAAAQCGDVLEALIQGSLGAEDALDARITERGRSLSGGQRQRLALARSLITDPGVLVLDEPTSAVDSHTEARVADGIRSLRAGSTTIVLTSSPLLLDLAEHVVLVHEGKVTAVGLHRDLIHKEPRYRAVVTRETDEETAPADGPERQAATTGEADAEPTRVSGAEAKAVPGGGPEPKETATAAGPEAKDASAGGPDGKAAPAAGPARRAAFAGRPPDRKTALSDVLDELEEIEETA
ncbi:ABC transporter transmembrane domain-containing protein [Streptomyces europaeiscabiei]|uniref:ABC transporter transmembrane domain-containing protein n=1 Tax=Streptomyces europaeiscabiei TaxID=146819 RepID=UPI0029AD8D87|nr:ABC transporter transmembrane domain-containing protein [Streptomyces europaeiscabiei]MDX3582480.1 ABC transporter transmembrane domain-containing protein [Streptomyces europaeiscabiei]